MLSQESISAVSQARKLPVHGRVGEHARRDVPAAPASHNIHAEDEDAKMTGMTRSLQRRLLGLNFPVRGEGQELLRKIA